MDREKLRVSDLQFPHYHWRVLEAVQAFADADKQAKWRLPASDYDTLDENWNVLGDALMLDGDCHRYVGVSLRDDLEATALERLAEALRAITDALGRNATPGQCFDHPGWPLVVETARKAAKLLERGDY